MFLKKIRFGTLREFGETKFTINGLRKGKIGNLVVKIPKEFEPCNMQFDREVAGGAFFKSEMFESAKTEERHTLTLGLYHISMPQLEWFSQYMICSLSRSTR
jgi:hypothetical protein